MTKSALLVYRAALRATRVAFNGDSKILTASRLKIREGYDQNRNLTDKEEINKAITDLDEVAKFLVKNIVQAEEKEKDKYFLHFHKDTELGDNATIKQNNRANMGSLAGAKVRRCSDNK